MGIVSEILQDGEKGAKHLFDEYGGRLTAAALSLCGNEADAKDLVSETVDIAVRQIGSYRNEAVFFEWLCGIMKNLYRHSRRRMSATNEFPMAELPDTSVDGAADGASQIVQAVDAGILRDAVNALPHEMREAVVLRYFMDMPLAQIAKFLSLPVGTVKSRLHYARFALASRLGEQLKKPAVAAVAAGLIIAAATAATALGVFLSGATDGEGAMLSGAEGDARLATVVTVEERVGRAEAEAPEAIVGADKTVGEAAASESAASSSISHSNSKLPSSNSNKQGETAMNIKAKAATALAAATLAATPAANANTVAWYHFNEGANGEIMRGGNGVYAVTNSVDPTSLNGRAYRITGTAFDVYGDGVNMPLWTNGTPSCVSWYDPATGARGADNRCMWSKSYGNNGTRSASIILVDDDEKLHCANLTAECMVKMPEGASLNYNWISILAMRNGLTASDFAWGIRAMKDGRMMVHIVDVNNSANNFNGATLGTGRGDSGYFYTPTPGGTVPNIADGKWHHLAITYDGKTVRAYIDYALAESIAWSGSSGSLVYGSGETSKLCIGGFDAATYGNWPGCIDEVRISSEALPPEKFLRVGGLVNNASDQDTAIYLPFNSFETSNDAFFGAIQNENPVLLNSACSTNAGLIDVKLSTITAGILPRLDTGASAVASDTLHAGIFAVDSFANEGCWTYTNNLAYSGKARYIMIDDYSKNNNTHLITAGDFTAEFYLKFMGMPTTTTRLLCENSGASGMGTLDFRVASSGLSCTMISQDELDKVESGAASSAKSITLSTSVDDMVDGAWHHVALVVDRARQTVTLYLDRNPVATQASFVLASSVSTKSDGYKALKIGDGWGGNNPYGFQNMSIDEYRITRRALAPQEFLMTGAAPISGALEPTRAWIGFEGDLSVEPNAGVIPDGEAPAGVTYSSDVPGVLGGEVFDGSGNVLRKFSADGRAFFDRNILIERDMESQTIEFFMKGTKGGAKAWAYFVRMYSNSTGAETGGQRIWSVGYRSAAGDIYVVADNDGTVPAMYYPDNSVSFADGRWHHVAITFEPDGNGNTICRVYRDYKQIGTARTFTGRLQTVDVVGYSCMALGNDFNGHLDEVRISKGVLTVDQMMHVRKGGTIITIH